MWRPVRGTRQIGEKRGEKASPPISPATPPRDLPFSLTFLFPHWTNFFPFSSTPRPRPKALFVYCRVKANPDSVAPSWGNHISSPPFPPFRPDSSPMPDMGLSASGNNHHRRRSSALTGTFRFSQPGPSERRDDNGLRPGDGGQKWDEQEPLTAEDTDASELSTAVVENRELDLMSSDDDQYDEETGLTAHQKRQRRRRRRQRRKLDARIADVKSSRYGFLSLGLADRNVAKKLIINAGLILMWYFFSLSISIVRMPYVCPSLASSSSLNGKTNSSLHRSTTNGCSPKAKMSFLSLSSRLACIWPSNSPSPLFCSGSFRPYALATHQTPP